MRSGADVVKAVALGAKAVGMGRPFLYANGTHGQEGVERLVESKRSFTFPSIFSFSFLLHLCEQQSFSTLYQSHFTSVYPALMSI